MGPLADEGSPVVECENRLTPQRGVSVIRKPGEEFRVDGRSLSSVYVCICAYADGAESPLYASGCHAEDTYDAFEGCSENDPSTDPGNESRPETGDGAESWGDEDKDDETQVSTLHSVCLQTN